MSKFRTYEEMTDDELHIIAAKKTRRGIATERALEAQAELHSRVHWDEVDDRMWVEEYVSRHSEDDEEE